MPKIKQSEEQELNNIVRGCIKKGEEIAMLSEEQIAVKLHFTKRTYQNKKKRPETFTFGELRKLSKLLKFDGDVLKEVFGVK